MTLANALPDTTTLSIIAIVFGLALVGVVSIVYFAVRLVMKVARRAKGDRP